MLTIAGSDSGGASGIQADLKTAAAFGLHGLSAITAVTAQNTGAILSIHYVPARHLERQIQAAFADFRIGAVKIGMLGSAANVSTVCVALRRARARNIVLDPVLAASSGAVLLSGRGLIRLCRDLIPMVDLLTPNLPEAEILLGRRIPAGAAADAARELLRFGARAVLLKGGHARGRVVEDVLVHADGVITFRHPRLPVRARGTGCTLATAIASQLALGRTLPAAVETAQTFLQTALRDSYRPGRSAVNVLRQISQGRS